MGCSPAEPTAAFPADLVLQQQTPVRPSKRSERQLWNFVTVSRKGAAHFPSSTNGNTPLLPDGRSVERLVYLSAVSAFPQEFEHPAGVAVEGDGVVEI